MDYCFDPPFPEFFGGDPVFPEPPCPDFFDGDGDCPPVLPFEEALPCWPPFLDDFPFARLWIWAIDTFNE